MKNIVLCSFSGLLLLLSLNPSRSAEIGGVPIPQGSKLLFAAIGEGFQIYESKAASAGGFHWALKAPDATLKTLAGETFAKHGAGPSWAANDGSKLVVKMPPLTSVKAADAKNIPWLLLSVESQGSIGVLSPVKYVLRVDTAGGLAPKEAPTTADQTAKIPYRAIYLFLAGEA
jgi:hypothetical protein